MDMLDIILHRRSVRQYTDEAIPEEKLMAILHAGLAAASSKNRRPWEFILVQDRSMLDKLSACRPGAANLLGKCKAAIVVTAVLTGISTLSIYLYFNTNKEITTLFLYTYKYT